MSMHDDIRRQLMWSRLIAVVEEQARMLMLTAFSATVREAGDLSAGVFDLRGRMVAQAITGTPGHVNSMAEAVPHFLKEFPPETMVEGDHFITNDPWIASGHLHDITVVSPVFRNGKVFGVFKVSNNDKAMRVIGEPANHNNRRRAELRPTRDQRIYKQGGAKAKR